MSYDSLRPPAHTRLFAQFADALESGVTGARVETPAYRRKEQPIGDVLADLIGGEQGQEILALLLYSLGQSIKSNDPAARLPAYAAAAGLAKMHADYHSDAAALDAATAEDEFAADYSDAHRLMQKDAAMEQA